MSVPQTDVAPRGRQAAARGASLAEAAGFRAQGMAIEGTPAWKAIVHAVGLNRATSPWLAARPARLR